MPSVLYREHLEMIQFLMGLQQNPSALMHSTSLWLYIFHSCAFMPSYIYIFFSMIPDCTIIPPFLQQSIKYSKRATKGSSDMSSAESCLRKTSSSFRCKFQQPENPPPGEDWFCLRQKRIGNLDKSLSLQPYFFLPLLLQRPWCVPHTKFKTVWW